jgi:GTP pyrophosphokinase
VYRARCCSPIRGEPIVGYITRGKGVSVHSMTCRNVRNLLYDPERRIAVEWEANEDTSFEVSLSVEVEDRPGFLASITAILADLNTDIRKIEARTFDDETAAIELTLRVRDLRHLERLLKGIKALTGVITVERQAS